MPHEGTPASPGGGDPDPASPNRDALERGGGRYPLQGAQPTPSHCLPDAKRQFQWHWEPTVTAPDRFGNLLPPPTEPPLGPPLRSRPCGRVPVAQGSAGAVCSRQLRQATSWSVSRGAWSVLILDTASRTSRRGAPAFSCLNTGRSSPAALGAPPSAPSWYIHS